MIVPVDQTNAREWARMCAKFHGDDIEHYLSQWDAPDEEHFLYETDGIYVGLLDLALRTDYVEGTDSRPVGYIEGIFVEESYRKRGIAREFILFAKQWTADKGARELASDAEIVNTTSIAFHSAVGFEEANRIVHFVMKLG